MSAIDFRLVPADTLVDVVTPKGVVTAFFVGIDDDEREFIVSVLPSVTRGDAVELLDFYKQIRISDKNPWLPWFGGECPVPPNCFVDVKYWESGPSITGHGDAGDFDWDLISHYRLCASEWQIISGVCDE